MNMDGEFRLRDVRESDLCDAQKHEIEADIERFDDALSGLIFALARRPDLGERIAQTTLWRIVIYMRPPRGRPKIRVWYRFDDDTVYLEAIENVP